MNVIGLNQEQKQALLDLLIIGMYADHNLASAEGERIEQLLDAFKFHRIMSGRSSRMPPSRGPRVRHLLR